MDQAEIIIPPKADPHAYFYNTDISIIGAERFLQNGRGGNSLALACKTLDDHNQDFMIN